MKTLDFLTEMLSKIPGTFWGVVIGAFISLLGVVFTSYANERRQRMQFLHERTLRNDDRETMLRKDVYLAVAEAIQAGLVALSKFSDLTILPESLLKDYLEKSPSIAKVHIVATEDTIEAVMVVAGEITSSVVQLSLGRLPLFIDRGKIDLLSSEILGYEKERERWLEELKKFDLEGQIDHRRRAFIEENYNQGVRNIADSLKRKIGMEGDLLERQLEFTGICLRETSRLSEMIVPAVSAMRQELRMTTNSTRLKQIYKASAKRQAFIIDEFIRDANKFASDIMPKTP